MKEIASNRCFDGWQKRYSHQSSSCGCEMTFGIYLPPQAESEPVPVLYWLSGLTCTDENFATKAGAQRVAAELGVALVMPDTSPRGVNLPGEDDSYDFGSGAGFYVNASQAPWDKHYRMYDYVVDELPQLIEQSFPVTDKRSIFGHSMGGHGALIVALKNPARYQSVSAFAPIVAPSQIPWGQKALRGYLGDDEQHWQDYDATALLLAGHSIDEVLIDQGDQDQFLAEQLKPELFEVACKAHGVKLQLNYRKGYDHSYFFIASFIDEHLHYHHERLTGR